MLVPRSVFALHKLSTDEPGRFSLNGVRFEPGPVAIGSDGAMLMAIRWKEPAESPPLTAIVPTETCRAAERIKLDSKRLRHKPELDCVTMDAVQIAATDGITTQQLAVEPLAGSFPEWQKWIVPESELKATIKVDAARLIKLLTLAVDQVGDRVTLGFGSKGELVVTGAKGDRSVYGALSPL